MNAISKTCGKNPAEKAVYLSCQKGSLPQEKETEEAEEEKEADD